MKYVFIAFTAAAFLISCNPKTAEVVEVAQTEEAATTDGDMPKADIGEGKVIFLEDCVGCHGDYAPGPRSVEDLDNFSKERIATALPRMIENANLNKTQSRQVTAYLNWEMEN